MASTGYDWLKMAEADKALTRAQKLMREGEAAKLSAYSGMEPRKNPRQPIFRDHNCWKCRDGELPCAERDYGRCSCPHARND